MRLLYRRRHRASIQRLIYMRRFESALDYMQTCKDLGVSAWTAANVAAIKFELV